MGTSIDRRTGVTFQQEQFAVEYVKTGRPAVAYRRAYNAEKMSKEAISVEASRLLSNPNVTLRVEHHRRIAEDALRVDVQDVARMMARVAMFDIRNCFDDEGNALPPHELPENVALAIGSIEVVEVFSGTGRDRVLTGYVKKFRATERNGAIGMLGRWKKMLTERGEAIDPNDARYWSDDELKARIKENEEVLALIEKSRARPKEKTVNLKSKSRAKR